MNWHNIFDLLHGEMASGFVTASLARLLLAAFWAGSSGWSANCGIAPRACAPTCSSALARPCSPFSPTGLAVRASATQRASQRRSFPGIGFIGAGSILHNRGLTTGLTTAATLFVVASVGMAAGGGLYVTAVFATGWFCWRSLLSGYCGANFQLENLAGLLRSYRSKRGTNQPGGQPHPGASTSHDAKCCERKHWSTCASTI